MSPSEASPQTGEHVGAGSGSASLVQCLFAPLRGAEKT
jgi:hypothetical protein